MSEISASDKEMFVNNLFVCMLNMRKASLILESNLRLTDKVRQDISFIIDQSFDLLPEDPSVPSKIPVDLIKKLFDRTSKAKNFIDYFMEYAAKSYSSFSYKNDVFDVQDKLDAGERVLERLDDQTREFVFADIRTDLKTFFSINDKSVDAIENLFGNHYTITSLIEYRSIGLRSLLSKLRGAVNMGDLN